MAALAETWARVTADLAARTGLPRDAVVLAIAFLTSILVMVALFAWTRRKAPAAEGSAPAPAAEGGALAQLAAGLQKTRARLGLAIRKALGQEVSDETLAELEAAMLEADMGVATTETLLEKVKAAFREKRARSAEELTGMIRDDLAARLMEKGNALRFAEKGPTVVLIVGVNGAGKTTSIAKLTRHLTASGKKVLLAAGDTFRAAAVQQLQMWADRLKVPIVKGDQGGDPAAVAFDATDAAIARGVDVLIVDTAGRLHNQQNLMNELAKVKRVIQKRIPEAPHETLLVLDATAGQNALQQAKSFARATDVSGIFLAKLDGTAKGGIVVSIKNELDIPVKFVGLGEKAEDIQPFDAQRFAAALLA